MVKIFFATLVKRSELALYLFSLFKYSPSLIDWPTNWLFFVQSESYFMWNCPYTLTGSKVNNRGQNFMNNRTLKNKAASNLHCHICSRMLIFLKIFQNFVV